MEQVETERRERFTGNKVTGERLWRNKRAKPREMAEFGGPEKEGPPRKLWKPQERTRWAEGSGESLEAAVAVSLYEGKSELV